VKLNINRSRYGGAGRDFILFTKLGEGTQELGSHCDATFSYSLFGHEVQKKYNDGEYCNVNTVDPPLFSLPLAIPIKPKYAATLNHFMQKAMNEGVFQELVDKYRPYKGCGNWLMDLRKLEEESEVDDVQLDVEHFLGITTILVLAVLFALCWKGANKIRFLAARKPFKRNVTNELEHNKTSTSAIEPQPLEDEGKDAEMYF